MTAPAWGRFPDFDEDFKYAEIADDSLRNQLIEETVAVPMSQLTALDADQSTTEAIGDWHYWVAQGYQF